jgi:hypothetical protein
VTDVHNALDRADQEAFTREPPKGLQARVRFVLRQLKTTKAVAGEIGVSQRSVERNLKGERKRPPKAIAERIQAAVRARWQPHVRKRRRQQAATATGITVETRARFGCTAPITQAGICRERAAVPWPVVKGRQLCPAPLRLAPAGGLEPALQRVQLEPVPQGLALPAVCDTGHAEPRRDLTQPVLLRRLGFVAQLFHWLIISARATVSG